MKIMFYDLETTGLLPSVCGIHQISGAITELVHSENRVRIIENFDFKVRPFVGKRVYSSALEVGGLSYDDISKYTEPIVVYKFLMQIIKNHVNNSIIGLSGGAVFLHVCRNGKSIFIQS